MSTITSVLSKISIDIVEIVIVTSDEYYLFKKLQFFLPKLQDPKRVSRINDKLTKVYSNGDNLSYRLNNCEHREYDKPAYVSYENTYFIGIMYSYYLNGINNRDNGFLRINAFFRDNGSEYYNSDNSQELLIYEGSYQEFNMKLIMERGFRYF